MSLMIFRALQEEEREEEVWEEEEPPILERGRSDRMEDKVSPHQSAKLIYPSYVGLFFLFEETLFPHISLGNSWCAHARTAFLY